MDCRKCQGWSFETNSCMIHYTVSGGCKDYKEIDNAVIANGMFYPHPLPPLVQKTRDDIVIDTCLDVVGLHGEDRTIAEMQIKYRLGIWEKPPCER